MFSVVSGEGDLAIMTGILPLAGKNRLVGHCHLGRTQSGRDMVEGIWGELAKLIRGPIGPNIFRLSL